MNEAKTCRPVLNNASLGNIEEPYTCGAVYLYVLGAVGGLSGTVTDCCSAVSFHRVLVSCEESSKMKGPREHALLH